MYLALSSVWQVFFSDCIKQVHQVLTLVSHSGQTVSLLKSCDAKGAEKREAYIMNEVAVKCRTNFSERHKTCAEFLMSRSKLDPFSQIRAAQINHNFSPNNVRGGEMSTLCGTSTAEPRLNIQVIL